MKFRFLRRKSEPLAEHLLLGERGEAAAAKYLEKFEGYRVVARHVSLPIGRNLQGATIRGEIDIVAYDHETLCFVEVKTRTSEEIAKAEAAVDRRKRRTLARSAAFYRRWMRLQTCPYRFDVVNVTVDRSSDFKIELRKGHFTDPGSHHAADAVYWRE